MQHLFGSRMTSQWKLSLTLVSEDLGISHEKAKNDILNRRTACEGTEA